MSKEKTIQNEIRLALNPYAIIFRINVGSFSTADGRFISTGVPKGFSDLFGVRRSDGKAIFLEIKNEKGRASKEQLNFLERMKEVGAIVGIARSKEEAIRIVNEEI